MFNPRHHLTATAFAVLASAATLQAQKAAAKGPVWPPAPAPTRIAWTGEYRSEFDIGAKKRTGFLDRLAGKSKDVAWLKQPVSVAVDESGLLFVGDNELGLVSMDPAKHKMLFFSKTAPGAIGLPTGVAVDSKFVYVTDSAQSHLVVFDKEGHVLQTLGKAEGIKRPVGVAVDEARNLIVVVNGEDHSILLLNHSLKAIKRIGTRGDKPGQFNFPTYCCMLPGTGFAVADTANFRIQIFNYEGKFLRTFGQQGDYSGSFSMPKGMAADPDGNLYVVDAKFCNFQVFRTDGQVLTFVGAGGVGPGGFQAPCGIAIGKDGSVFVADTVNGRIQRFQYYPEAPKTASNTTDKREG